MVIVNYIRFRQQIHDTPPIWGFLMARQPFRGSGRHLDVAQCLPLFSTEHSPTMTSAPYTLGGLNFLPRLEGVDFSLNQLTVIKASAFRTPPYQSI
ncbi:hypothetical protein CEXT_272651 [Caerostris extrusa]|uniref:Uncharacterized protein n=1 Tax=Caerostris extrusa TaxID=172846 RepID=A0AAV4TX79_CAEEX|nr:hypothetical protein CEXT_272651 [Caerostris extrusa]